MNCEATDNAALRGRVADLEQQLALADEGTARLAQRCLELEQQVLAADPKQELHTGSPLLLPQLFYDTGSGFSAQDSLTAPANCCDELSHEVTATFELPADSVALRFDPGELACCAADLTISDERLTCRPANGIALSADKALFLHSDPQFMLEGLSRYPAGLQLVISYRYYPLEQLAHEPLFKAVLSGAEQAQRYKDEAEQSRLQSQQQLDAMSSQLEAMSQRTAALQQKLAQAELEQKDYEAALKNVYGSSSWKFTAPLRFISRLFHRG